MECCTKSAAAVVAGCRKVVVEKLTFVVKYIDDTLDQSPKKKLNITSLGIHNLPTVENCSPTLYCEKC